MTRFGGYSTVDSLRYWRYYHGFLTEVWDPFASRLELLGTDLRYICQRESLSWEKAESTETYTVPKYEIAYAGTLQLMHA